MLYVKTLFNDIWHTIFGLFGLWNQVSNAHSLSFFFKNFPSWNSWELQIRLYILNLINVKDQATQEVFLSEELFELDHKIVRHNILFELKEQFDAFRFLLVLIFHGDYSHFSRSDLELLVNGNLEVFALNKSLKDGFVEESYEIAGELFVGMHL